MKIARLGLGALFAGLFWLASLAGWGRVDAQDAGAPDIGRGGHIATALAGCADCHGANFGGGRPFTRAGVTVYAANLTPGPGGIATLGDADLRRAIRAGVLPGGSHLRVMPASEYAVMTDADVDDLVAFLRSLPPVTNVVARAPEPAAPGMARDAPVRAPAEEPGSLTGGAYLARIGGCTNCHGANLAGGAVFAGGVIAPNISRKGIGTWTFADFQTALRTGKTPDGRTLSKVMPWESAGRMTDDELRAVYDFLELHS